MKLFNFVKTIAFVSCLMLLLESLSSSILVQPVSAKISNSSSEDTDGILNPCREHLQAKQYEAALESCRQALDIYQKMKNKLGEAKALINLGNAYFFFK
ncbi:tetratricopeptide repeat protein [Microcoleus sp. OTE_8_concoct_300]|uniref:tetratricopeptide repeat protein n=1 Tax=Microcoleus sp. OTE_8_concoct_300 TaxID=2964710 RepID=UPI00403F14B4